MAGLDVDYYASGQYSCQPSTSAATPGMMTQNDADSVTSVMPGGDDLAESSSLQPEASKSKKQKNDKKPREQVVTRRAVWVAVFLLISGCTLLAIALTKVTAAADNYTNRGSNGDTRNHANNNQTNLTESVHNQTTRCYDCTYSVNLQRTHGSRDCLDGGELNDSFHVDCEEGQCQKSWLYMGDDDFSIDRHCSSSCLNSSVSDRALFTLCCSGDLCNTAYRLSPVLHETVLLVTVVVFARITSQPG